MTHVAGIKVDSSCLVVLVVRHCNHLPNPDCKLVVYNKDVLLFLFRLRRYADFEIWHAFRTFNYFPFGTDFGNFFYTFLAVEVLNNGFRVIEMADDTEENPVFFLVLLLSLISSSCLCPSLFLYRSCP